MSFSRSLKDAARRALLRAGLDVKRAGIPPKELHRLRTLGVRTLLDVGANTGQFARRMRPIVPEATIHAFEPLAAPFAALESLAARDPKLHAHRTALGDRDGEITIEANEFSPSSSLLPLGALHRQMFPYAARTTPESVPIARLDTWAAGRTLDEPLFLKLDVQGYEDRVLAGGPTVIGRACGLLVEVTFAPLFDGQVLFDALHRQLTALGFRCAGMIENTRAPSFEILQADCFYLRA